jgi:hypothetical protein
MAIEIGKQYKSAISESVMLYKHGIFEEEAKLIEQINGLFHPINCYSCLKRIEEKHILIKKNDGNSEEKLRFHTKCIDKLVNNNLLI